MASANKEEHVVEIVGIDDLLAAKVKSYCDRQLANGYALISSCCYTTAGGPSWLVLIFKG